MNPFLLRRSRVLLTILASVIPASAGDIHVSPAAGPAGDGSPQAPFSTLEQARDAARALAGREPVTIHLADGIYYLPSTFTLGPRDSGAPGKPVTYRAVREGGAVLSGGTRIRPDWKPAGGGVLATRLPGDAEIDRLFVNGVCQTMARYPDADPAKTTEAFQGCAADAISPQRSARWANPVGGYVHAMHLQRWGGYHYRITGKKPDGSLALEGGWQNNRPMGMHPEQRMVENILEELTAPGEWHHDRNSATLRWMPPVGVDPATAVVEVVRLPRLIDLRGSAEAKVRHIHFQGITFTHTARTFMETKEPLLRSDWAICRDAALRMEHATDIRVLDSTFDQAGGNAVLVSKHARRIEVRGCHIRQPGASGVVFVGDPSAVRDPLFHYDQGHDLAKIDRTPGPRNDLYPADCTVADCLIEGVGRVERQAAGVQVSMAARITITDTTVRDGSRAGINFGDGSWGGHLIDRCDVFNTVLETHDHGSFNSWGRDRFWDRNHRGVSEPAVKKDPALPFLDAVQTTVIRNSRWRCDHGWDIDLDDGSSNYDIHHNLMLAGGLKLREGYRRHAWNNIMVNNGFHPHVWFADSGDRFTGNIVMSAHKGVQVPTDEVRGAEIDLNLFFGVDPAAVAACHRFGWDRHSITDDPMFVDAASGDFRVRDDSPALKLGFTNFAMDAFGVKKPSLKALAGGPQIPPISPVTGSSATKRAPDAWWEGARLRTITGEEFSAFGTRREDGGVQVIELLPKAPARRAGLEANDLIQAIDKNPVRNLADLHRMVANHGNEPLRLTVIRTQTPRTLTLAPTLQLRTEQAAKAAGFKQLKPPTPPRTSIVAANPETRNDPLPTLHNGKLESSYGPVFDNGVPTGHYRIDLGTSRDIRAIRTWSFAMNGNRGHQRLTLHGSNHPADPGWNVADRTRYTPIASIDTTSDARNEPFHATSLEAAAAPSLGRWRWITWTTQPLTGEGEHTAFQELEVVTKP